MTDTSVTPPRNPLLSPAAFGQSLMRADVAVGLGVMGLIVLLLMPLPTWRLVIMLRRSS